MLEVDERNPRVVCFIARNFMARMRKSDWNPCEEFKKVDGRKSFNDGSIGTKQWNEKFISRNESENSIPRSRKIKTLTQASRSEVPRVREDLKKLLPKLTASEIRRFQIPRSESVILELREEGLRESAVYLEMLFELDEKMRTKAGPGSVVWSKPRLKDTKNLLERLNEGLRSAEIAKKTGNLPIQTSALLQTAIFFESESWEWFWIAEQLYRSCLKTGEMIQDDDGQILNIIRYLYGRFLFDKMNDSKQALDYLNEVRIASEGKTWNISKILGIKQETLYRESCALLHQALLSLSRNVRKENPELAVRAASHALERATDSGHDEAIASALYELGKSQLSAGDVKTALRTLSKFLAVSKRIPDPEGICNGHMELALAYKELEDSEGTVKHLSLFRQCAKQYNLSYKLAQAHYYTGEYLLNKNQANLATPHLELALEKFSNLGRTNEADRARCTAGISKGQEVMERYIDLISNCQVGNTEATLKICEWKNSRIPFWRSTKIDNVCSEKSIGDSSNDEAPKIFQASMNSLLSISSSTKRTSSIDDSEDVSQEPLESSSQTKRD